LYSWVALHPSKVPTVLAKLLQRVHNCDMFAPYFTLIGDFESLANCPALANVFSGLKMPEGISLVDDQSLMMGIVRCSQLFEHARFLDCAQSGTDLLKIFPTEKLRPINYLTLFFIYYWITSSFLAIGKSGVGLFYSKGMRCVLATYPFCVGFALFLELKCKIQCGKAHRLRVPPALDYRAQYT
jgi:hypothetical protein